MSSVFDLLAPPPGSPGSPPDDEPKLSRQQILDKIIIARREIQRRRYFNDGEAWVKERLKEHLWSKQCEVIKAVRDHRRVAVPSCHGSGKSFLVGRIAGWWLDRDKVGDAFVVTTAPTNNQVKNIVWREIGRVHAKGQLRGRVNQISWYMNIQDEKGKVREEIVAFGRKPDDTDMTAFQGIHAKRVLVIMDEATGIPPMLWEAADSLISNDESKIVVIGNPDDPSVEFARLCEPGSGYHVIPISAFDSPNFTGEYVPKEVAKQLIGRTYVEEKRKKWASKWHWTEDGTKVVPPEGADDEDTHPFWQSKVLGRFPQIATENGLIPQAWIRRAQSADFSATMHDGPTELGLDVGGGGDSSDICLRRNQVYRIIAEDHNPDTMQTLGLAIEKMRVTGSSLVKVDKVGIGWGIVNRAQEQKLPFIGVGTGDGPRDPKTVEKEKHHEEKVKNTREIEAKKQFSNLKAQLYWHLRTLFERGEIDIDEDDEELASQLVQIRFKRLSTGKIQIESKQDAKARGIASPNRAESLMLAAAPEVLLRRNRLVWGTKDRNKKMKHLRRTG